MLYNRHLEFKRFLKIFEMMGKLRELQKITFVFEIVHNIINNFFIYSQLLEIYARQFLYADFRYFLKNVSQEKNGTSGNYKKKLNFFIK